MSNLVIFERHFLPRHKVKPVVGSLRQAVWNMDTSSTEDKFKEDMPVDEPAAAVREHVAKERPAKARGALSHMGIDRQV